MLSRNELKNYFDEDLFYYFSNNGDENALTQDFYKITINGETYIATKQQITDESTGFLLIENIEE